MYVVYLKAVECLSICILMWLKCLEIIFCKHCIVQPIMFELFSGFHPSSYIYTFQLLYIRNIAIYHQITEEINENNNWIKKLDCWKKGIRNDILALIRIIGSPRFRRSISLVNVNKHITTIRYQNPIRG